MPRTIWSGAISFGLVTVPINVVSATEDHSIHFHQYHLEDMGRIRTRKVCEIEDREVASTEIGKGYELTKTQGCEPVGCVAGGEGRLRGDGHVIPAGFVVG